MTNICYIIIIIDESSFIRKYLKIDSFLEVLIMRLLKNIYKTKNSNLVEKTYLQKLLNKVIKCVSIFVKKL